MQRLLNVCRRSSSSSSSSPLMRRRSRSSSSSSFDLLLNHCKRSICSQPNPTISSASPSSDLHGDVLVQGNSHCRTAILNRPPALNSLNTSMGARLQKLYKSWENDPSIGFVMMKGSGRAFCAGGDIVTLYRQINAGRIEDCKEFFGTLYTFIYILGTYIKPHVALLNGVTMGGGGGVSIPGTFRVATDKTVFATPETIIGFHPDAGASFYLSHLPGYIGEYLALTGETLSGAEMLACGLATHYSLSAKLPLIEEHLHSLATDDFSVVETALQEFVDVVTPDNMSVLHRLDTLNKCFGQDTVEEIINSLEEEATKKDHTWCDATLRRLREVSPLSLKVSLRSIREGRYQTLDECLVREYRMSLQGISGNISNDFLEGVRARMVDRDFTPKWNPPSLDRVSEDMVDQYLSPLSESEPDLELPTKLREAFS